MWSGRVGPGGLVVSDFFYKESIFFSVGVGGRIFL